MPNVSGNAVHYIVQGIPVDASGQPSFTRTLSVVAQNACVLATLTLLKRLRTDHLMPGGTFQRVGYVARDFSLLGGSKLSCTSTCPSPDSHGLFNMVTMNVHSHPPGPDSLPGGSIV